MILSYDSVFYCQSTYQERFIPKDAGFRWDKDKKRWWTSNIDKAIELREYADKETIDIINQKLEEKNKQIDLSRATNIDIDIPVPEGLSYFNFQKAGINYISDKDNVLLADSMGLGKSIQIVGLINFIEQKSQLSKILIVCPSSVKINWKRELNKWLVNKRKIIVIRNKEVNQDADIYVVNYDILGKRKRPKKDEKIEKHSWLQDIEWDMLVVDEAHMIKNPKAIRTKYIQKLKCKRRFYLTGTPIVNNPKELFTLLQHLDFKMKWYEFMNTFCVKKQIWAGKARGLITIYEDAQNLDKLNKELRSSIMLRRLKKDVLKDLPPKTRQIIVFDSDDYQDVIQNESDALQNEQIEEYESKALANEILNQQIYDLKGVNVDFELISEIRHKSALAKLPECITHIKNVLENENKVVVFAHHRDVIKELHENFDNSVILIGGQSEEEKQRSIDNFQNDPNVNLFIGSIKAAGVGITLTAANTCIFVELGWTPAEMEQAEDRLYRIGQENPVLVQHLVIDNTLDANIAKTLVYKQDIIDRALDDKQYEKLAQYDPILCTHEPYTYIDSPLIENCDIILEALKFLSSLCDGASSKDGQGFNGCDTRIGKHLALRDNLTSKQCAVAKKILKKYKRQLPEEIYNTIYQGESDDIKNIS